MSETTPTGNQKAGDFYIEASYLEALRKSPVPVLVVYEDGRLLLANEAFQAATGLSHDDIPTIKSLTRYLSNDSALRFETHLRDVFTMKKILDPFQITIETDGDRSLIWEILCVLVARALDGRTMSVVAAKDVTTKIDRERHLASEMSRLQREKSRQTQDLSVAISAIENEIVERKHMDQALALSGDRLKQMSRRILDVLEADRRTISKELHDSIGASLAAIKFSLEEKELKRKTGGGMLEETLTQEIDYLLETIKETKRISANLRPSTLDDLGLMATIQWYIRQFQRLYGKIGITYQKDIVEEDVPETMKIIIYRLVQEGLTNAEKHSGAKSVLLHLGFSSDRKAIRVMIEDDGCGFDVGEVLSEKDPMSGYGLVAMRERCEIYGGTFDISSQKGRGTRIHATLPI